MSVACGARRVRLCRLRAACDRAQIQVNRADAGIRVGRMRGRCRRKAAACWDISGRLGWSAHGRCDRRELVVGVRRLSIGLLGCFAFLALDCRPELSAFLRLLPSLFPAHGDGQEQARHRHAGDDVPRDRTGTGLIRRSDRIGLDATPDGQHWIWWRRGRNSGCRRRRRRRRTRRRKLRCR